MVDGNLALVVGAIVTLAIVVSIPWGLALAARGRAADSDLALERRLHAEQRKRADDAEKRTKVLARVGRDYLARVPTGGVVDPGELGLLLDATEHAAGSAPPPGPTAPGATV